MPVIIYSPNERVEKIQEKFVFCERMFHHQFFTLIVNILGFDVNVLGCKEGVINCNLLTGDAGYLEFEVNKAPVFTAPKGRN